MIPVWPKVKLKSLYHGLYDGPHATPKESEDGAVFLGIKNVTEDGRLDLSEIRHIAEEDLAKWTKRVTPSKDDIVFSYEATLHRYARIPEGFRGCLGRRMALIRADKSKVDINYLFSYFLSPLWRAEVEKHILSGATVDRIPLTNVPEFELFLPPLPIQKKISAILTSYDDLIENNLKRIKLLEEMAQITYEEWFVRMKFPGHETAIFNEETGLPEGWANKKLGDIITLNYGKALKAEHRNEGKYPVYGSAGVVGFHDTPLVEDEGIILGRKGNVGAVHWSFEHFYPIDTVYYVTSEHSLHYVYYLLKHQEFINNDAAVPGLNRNAAYAKKITLPAAEVVNQFDSKVLEIFSLIHNIQRQNDVLKEARDILLPRLMTGMIDIEQVELPEAMISRLEQQEDKMATAV